VRLKVESESQEEFDAKRPELIKAIAGSKLDVEIRRRGQKKPLESRDPHYRAQKEMLDYWNKKFNTMIEDLKAEINEIIK
jgi:hypothetical protein